MNITTPKRLLAPLPNLAAWVAWFHAAPITVPITTSVKK